jgi:hypothetical protein
MSDRNQMTCAEMVEVVTDYIENAVPTSERTRVDAHLEGCAGCTNYLSQMRTTIRLTGSLTETTVSGGTVEALMDTFRDLRRT